MPLSEEGRRALQVMVKRGGQIGALSLTQLACHGVGRHTIKSLIRRGFVVEHSATSVVSWRKRYSYSVTEAGREAAKLLRGGE